MKIAKKVVLLSMAALLLYPSVSKAEAVLKQETNVYHCHTGNGSGGGGCFGNHQVGNKTEQVWAEHRQCGSSDNSCGHNNMSVNVCQQDVGPGWVTKTVHYDYWTRNCEKETDTLLAKFECQKSTEEWVKELTLTAFYEVVNDAIKIKDEPYLWNGAASIENVYTVSNCGTYTAQLNADDNADTEGAKITYDIRNIDNEPPKIQEIICDKTPNLEKTEIFITAEDLQLDGSEGCGLHEEAYSFDGGLTWQKEPSKVVGNGVFEIVVRDSLENESRGSGNAEDDINVGQVVVVDTIDDQAPFITDVIKDPDYWTRDSVKVTVKAEDFQDDKPGIPDGGHGCGIGFPETPYSWDGGKTWSKDNWNVAKDEKNYQFVVRDKLDHRTTQEIKVENFDRGDPTIHLYIDGNEKEWYEGSVTLKVDAEDTRSGLAEQPYSWDSGGSWGYSGKYEVSDSGTYEVWVRDWVGNIAKDSITVTKQELILPEEEETVSPILWPTQPKTEQKKQLKAKGKVTKVSPKTEIQHLKEEKKKTIKVESSPNSVTPPEVGGNILETTAKASIAVVCLLGLAFFFSSAGIYAKDLKGKFVVIGRSIIYPGKGGFKININKYQKKRAQSDLYEIHFSKLWLKGRKELSKVHIYEENVFKVTKDLTEKITL